MKLYEIILKKIGLSSQESAPANEVQEDLIYNPIGCKVGAVVKIDSLDFRDHRFTVKEILEYSVSVGGNKHSMVDYVLSAPGMNCRLRMVPDPDSQSRTTHRALLLTLYDEFGYSEDLHAVVKDDTKKFVIDDDSDPNNIIHDEFWRVNDVGISYQSRVKKLADTDSSGKVDKREITTSSVEFWDYSRMTNLEGVEVEEFFFVEMDTATGYFVMWRGSEVNPERIDVF